jgi:RNA polymerase sigma-70 factor (ECF subfamily)
MDSAASQCLARARSGDAEALSQVLAEFAPRLERMVLLRMDARHARQFDAADVVQDALVEATRRFDEWRAQADFPLHVWLRLLTAQCLARAHRRLHQEKRDVARELPESAAAQCVSAAGAAEWWVSTHTSPTQAARRNELRDGVRAALDQLDELDREVLTLRLFEQLTNEEAAAELGVEPAAASKRFARALQRVRPALAALEASTESRGS